jgi:hypothetical protein
MNYIFYGLSHLSKSLGKENLRNSKNKEFSFWQNLRFLDAILHAGELSEAGDITNFQILLIEKYKTGTNL